MRTSGSPKVIEHLIIVLLFVLMYESSVFKLEEVGQVGEKSLLQCDGLRRTLMMAKVRPTIVSPQNLFILLETLSLNFDGFFRKM